MACYRPITLGSRTVPCGKCNFCLQVKRAEWSFRLREEVKVCSSAQFLTLTYEDKHIVLGDAGPTLVKSDLQNFTKRLRKVNGPVRYYSVGEYGTLFERPHYHSIMFNCVLRQEQIEKVWGLGQVHVGEVTDASIHYVTGYVIDKAKAYPGRVAPFAFMSKRPGIGGTYLSEAMKQFHLVNAAYFVTHDGYRQAMPRYLRDKVFVDDEMKELHRLEMVEVVREGMIKEMERIKNHPDPARYFGEMMKSAHDRVRSKGSKF